MKKTIVRELIRFLVTVGSALLGSSALGGCASIPLFIF